MSDIEGVRVSGEKNDAKDMCYENDVDIRVLDNAKQEAVEDSNTGELDEAVATKSEWGYKKLGHIAAAAVRAKAKQMAKKKIAKAPIHRKLPPGGDDAVDAERKASTTEGR